MASRIALYVPSLRGGGIARVFTTLARGFVEAGYAVDLLLARRRGPLLRQVPQSVRVVDFGAAHVSLTVPALVRYLRRRRPAALFSAPNNANLAALVAGRLAGGTTRVIPTEHSVFSHTVRRASSLKQRALVALVRRAYRCAEVVVTVSQGAACDLAACTRLTRKQIEVIYNPVAGLPASLSPRRKRSRNDGGMPLVLGAGRLVAGKDFATLLRAFARLRRRRPARLVLLGEGKERAALEALARRLSVRDDLEMPGFVEDPFSYMQRASALAISSRSEAFGNVLVEAMACGTPVVSTDCPGGPAEILQGGRLGPLVPVGDSAALACAIDTALDDPVPAAALKERAADFSIERAVEAYLALVPE